MTKILTKKKSKQVKIIIQLKNIFIIITSHYYLLVLLLLGIRLSVACAGKMPLNGG